MACDAGIEDFVVPRHRRTYNDWRRELLAEPGTVLWAIPIKGLPDGELTDESGS
jgi:hypothetical protein